MHTDQSAIGSRWIGTRRVVVAAAAAVMALASAVAAPAASAAPRFSDPTDIDNKYLPLTKFERCVLAGEEDGAEVRVVRTLLDRREPFEVDGRTVRLAVIKDKAFEDGELVERTLDYFGQADNGTVHYFGEDVNDYEDGELVGHSGAWRYGEDTNRLGVAMPRNPQVGDSWYFEFVPGITIERDEVMKKLDQKRVGGRAYEDVLRIRETIEPQEETEYKLYAKGVGNIREIPPDGKVDLVHCDREDDD